MIQEAKIIGTTFATTVLIGASVGISIVFGALIIDVSRNPYLRTQSFSYAMLVISLLEAAVFLALNIVFSLLVPGLVLIPALHIPCFVFTSGGEDIV